MQGKREKTRCCGNKKPMYSSLKGRTKSFGGDRGETHNTLGKESISREYSKKWTIEGTAGGFRVSEYARRLARICVVMTG